MAITPKQGIAMAVIVAVGLLGGAGVLFTQRHAGEAAHAEEAGHADEAVEGHAKAEKDEHGTQADEKSIPQQIKLDAAQLKAAAITMQTVGAGTLQASTSFQGEVRFDEERTAHVVPQLAGVAQTVSTQLGQRVRQGEVLAVISSTALAEQRSELLTAQKRRELARSTFEREKKLWQERISAEQDYLQAQSALQEADIAVRNANAKLAAVGAAGASSSLNRYEVRAPFAGTVVERHLSIGEAVKEDASIFTLSDLSRVAVEFAVAPQDLARVRVGQIVEVSSSAFDGSVSGRISYVGALIGEQTRSAKARVSLTNPEGAWRPGLFVTVAVRAADQPIALAVSRDSVQTIDERPTVFVVTPGGFTARSVKLGRSDAKNVEVVEGLQAGEQVAASNTFVLKSELGKASAGHGH